MKHTVFTFMIFSLILIACTDEISKVSDVQITDLKDHNMKIIPENPTTKDDIKLVVFDDCNYNLLTGIIKNGKSIEIRKQFNSMMKWPCFQSTDTITLGKLSEGTYTVNYKLIDISTQVTNPIALSFYFSLQVSQ